MKKPKMTQKEKELGILASQPKGRAFITLLGGTSNSLRLEIQLMLGAAGGDRSWSTASPPSALSKIRKGLTLGVAGGDRSWSTASLPSALGVTVNRRALVAVGGHPNRFGMSLRLPSALRCLPLGHPKGRAFITPLGRTSTARLLGRPKGRALITGRIFGHPKGRAFMSTAAILSGL